MIHITRLEAETKINKHWETAAVECKRVNAPVPKYSIDRTRNYEIEQELKYVFKEEHVICEWCPYNGIFCKWMDNCDLEELEKIIYENRGLGVVCGYNRDYLADYAEAEIKKRFK